MITKVVGVTFTNDDGSSRASIIARMRESDKIFLEREPLNPYDSNAVKVLVHQNGEKKQIGYLSKDVAAEVSSKLRRNYNFKINIEGVGLWEGRPYCSLQITATEPTVTVANTSQTQTKASPTFTPNKTAAPSPTFTPNRPAAAAPSPTFTAPKPAAAPVAPKPVVAPAASASTSVKPTPSVTPAKPAVSTPSPSTTSEPRPASNSDNSGCFGVILLLVVTMISIFIAI